MARLRRLQRPHKATLGRPTWKRGQLKSLSLPNVRSKEGRKERRKIFPWGKSFAPLLPPLSLAPFQFPISLAPSPSLFCSLTNHPYLNVCNGIGLMPLHRRREDGGGGERYRDKGQVERWVPALMARNDLTLFFPRSKYENDNNLKNFIASIEDSVQAESNTQLNSSGRTNTLIKRRSARPRPVLRQGC